MIIQKIFLSLALITSICVQAQHRPTPAPAQKGSILLTNCYAHLGNGKVIENAYIAFENGVITLVADATISRIDVSKYSKVIPIEGQHVYPGFIAPNSSLGLVEIDAIRAQNDLYEVGTFKPSVRSIIAYNTDSEIIPTVRSNGVLIGQITPRGGIISGTSSVVQFDAWNWEDAAIRVDDGLHLNWPQVIHRHYDKGKMAVGKSKSYDQQKREIYLFFEEAKAYCSLTNHEIKDVRFESMCGIFNGTQSLYVHADEIKSILEMIQFKLDFNIEKLVLVGGYDAPHCAEILNKHNVSVLLRRVHDLAVYPEDNPHASFELPAQLYNKKVKFAFQNEGDMERMGTRNLPFMAGTAVAHGLPYEEAVKALTLSAADILGIGKQYGSLEVGKSATFFVSFGDALNMTTNEIRIAYIDGRQIELGNMQSEMYYLYKNKYDRERNKN
jgi:imidazolonepropionase-like amidohydrolase